MKNKPLTYNELMKLALDNYSKGGDSVFECWDESTFNEYVKEFGDITKNIALGIFSTMHAIEQDYRATAW